MIAGDPSADASGICILEQSQGLGDFQKDHSATIHFDDPPSLARFSPPALDHGSPISSRHFQSPTYMILGIGIDILSLSRFQAVVSRRGIDKVAKRICTPRELVNFHNISSITRGPSSTLSSNSDSNSDLDSNIPVDPLKDTHSREIADDNALLDRQIRFLSSRQVHVSAS